MLKYRGHLGFLIIVASEILMFSGVELISRWFTPIVWTGYILLMDEINYRLGGWSLIMDRRRIFVLMIPISIACWSIFEVYNLHMKNWEYLNLPENMWVRYIGYGYSFATILPGIFQTYYFLVHINFSRRFRSLKRRSLDGSFAYLVLTGVAFLVIPLITPEAVSKYLFGAVWVGFILLLEPINHRLGFRSIIGDIEDGNYATMVDLFAAGIICGLLWEFWNFWAVTKWIYTLPFPVGFRIFEMPALGFLGFLPFAIECYSMFNFCALRSQGSSSSPSS